MLGSILLLTLFQAESAFDRGAALYRQRNYTDAIPELTKALETGRQGSAEHAEVMLLLGQSYFSLGKFTESIVWLEKRRALGDRLEIAYMLGTAYVQTRQPLKSRVTFAEMFDTPPDSDTARLINAQMMVRNGFEDEAALELQPALKSKSMIAGVHLLLGEVALFRGDLDASIAHFQRELRINPGSAMAYHRLGDAESRRERWDAAIRNLQKSIWLNPHNSGPYIVLGKVYQNIGSLANAEGMLRRAIQLDPRNASAHYLLGQTLVRAGQTKEGREVLDRYEQLRKAQ